MVTIRTIIRNELNSIAFENCFIAPNKVNVREHIEKIEYLLNTFDDISFEINASDIKSILNNKPSKNTIMKKTFGDKLKRRFASKADIMKLTITEVQPLLDELAVEMKMKTCNLMVVSKFFEIVNSLHYGE